LEEYLDSEDVLNKIRAHLTGGGKDLFNTALKKMTT
jgi:hypothetical protein